MSKAFLFLLFILLNVHAGGQNTNAVELSLTGRYDRHANYSTNFAGRAYNDTNKLYGVSYGIHVAYRRKFKKNISAIVGAGYYRLGVNKIRGTMPFNIPGTRTARNIDYDDGVTNLLYSTSKYHYNNLAVTVGLSKTTLIKDKVHLDFGAEGIGYFTFSQRYQLFNGDEHYATNNSKPLEFGINVNVGILKEYRKFYFRPALIIPVYQNLKGDIVFYERRSMNISKWFNGVGLILRVGKYL